MAVTFQDIIKGFGNVGIYDPRGQYIGYSTSGRDDALCRGIANIKPEGYSTPASQWYVKSFWGPLEPVSRRCIRNNFTPSWAIDAGPGSVTVPNPQGPQRPSGSPPAITINRPPVFTASDDGDAPDILREVGLPNLPLPLLIGGGLLAAILLLRR